MDLPKYPLFRPLVETDKSIFDRAFCAYPPEISEFTFTNLLSWNAAYRFSISGYGQSLLLRSDAMESPRFFDPIGPPEEKGSIVRELCQSQEAVCIRLPEATAGAFANDTTVQLTEDRPNFDYLYRAADLIELRGQVYDGKRNLIKKFKATCHYDYIQFNRNAEIPGLKSGDECVTITPTSTNNNVSPETIQRVGVSEDMLAECRAFESRWCQVKDCDHVQGLDHERAALEVMLSHFTGFGLRGAGIRLNGLLAGFALAEKLNSRTLVVHILKADPNVTGLYQTLLNEFLTQEAGDVELVNLEQDLGVAGLRRAKESYHPLRLVKKFSLANPKS